MKPAETYVILTSLNLPQCSPRRHQATLGDEELWLSQSEQREHLFNRPARTEKEEHVISPMPGEPSEPSSTTAD
jgi:hypothetical protein